MVSCNMYPKIPTIVDSDHFWSLEYDSSISILIPFVTSYWPTSIM
jgi:hypothetical protein